MDRKSASCAEEGGCQTTGNPCFLYKLKEAWIKANFPIVKDTIILKKILQLKKEYQERKWREARMTPEESADYRDYMEATTFNLSIPAWREEIRQDMLLTDEEREAKVATLEDFIGDEATR